MNQKINLCMFLDQKNYIYLPKKGVYIYIYIYQRNPTKMLLCYLPQN